MPRLDYFAPGVYIEEIDRGSRPIEGVPTNVGGFIGFTETVRGGAELYKLMLVTSWDQYRQYFAKEGSDGFTGFDAYLPFAVQGWFLNGGGRCYVMSIGTEIPGSIPPEAREEIAGYQVKTATKRPSLTFQLQGDSPIRTTVAILPGDPAGMSSNDDDDPPVAAEFFTIKIIQNDIVLEEFKHLTMNRDVRPEVGVYVVNALNRGDQVRPNTAPDDPEGTSVAVATRLRPSQLLTVIDDSQQGLPLTRRPVNGIYEVAPPLALPNPRQFYGKVQGARDEQTGIQGTFEMDDINILAFPDLMRAYEARNAAGERLLDLDRVHAIMELMVSLCENATPNPANRMVVLDTPPGKNKPQDVVNWLNDFGRRSMYAALYYPWIKVANPRANR